MQFIFTAVILIVILLSGCHNESPKSNYDFNANIPIYCTDNGTYFTQRNEKNEEWYDSIMYKDATGEKIVETMPDHYGMITNIFVNGEELYYSYVTAEAVAYIYSYNIVTGVSNKLFTAKTKNHTKTFLYSAGKDVYYFSGGVLWKYADDTYNIILSDIDSCAIDSEGIYYAIGNDIFFRTFNGEGESIISQDVIYRDAASEKMIQITGGCTVIENLILKDNKLYFGLSDSTTDSISKRKSILVWDISKKTLSNVCEKIIAYSNFEVVNDDIYMYGRNIEDKSIGVFRINKNGSPIYIASDNVSLGFHIYNGYLFYYFMDLNSISPKLQILQIS